jgi:uncharacterized protein YvpB
MIAVATACLLTGCSTTRDGAPRTHLVSFDRFEPFERTQREDEIVLLSPRVPFASWNELIVSWNAACPPGTALKAEACAFHGSSSTRFYTMALWSAEAGRGRTSVRGERDRDAFVDTDTLICRHMMNAAQVRLTLHGTNGVFPRLKLLTLSFLNSKVPARTLEPNRRSWGKILDVPERSQLGHPGASGWCSPTALSMMLAYWSREIGRTELDVPVPHVAHEVYDTAYRGTGNWAFNMAYAGAFDGMCGYVTRFNDFREVEDCVAAGIPVALSVSFDLLNGKTEDQNSGHLIVVAGFTEKGDVVVNDPWPNPKKENRVRKIFPRERVMAAWQRSKQAVYVVFPEGRTVPYSF